jgi:hypothetical protein
MTIIPHLMRDEYSALRLQHNEVGDAGAEEIAGALCEDKSHCQILDLRNNKVTDKGAKFLGDALSTNVYLAEVYLSYNQILGAGAAALSESFTPTTGGFSAVTILDLRSCGIDDEGAAVMGKNMVGNTALKHIYLSANRIGDAGATALAEALQNERCKMYSVNLSNNMIRGQGGKMIGYVQVHIRTERGSGGRRRRVLRRGGFGRPAPRGSSGDLPPTAPLAARCSRPYPASTRATSPAAGEVGRSPPDKPAKGFGAHPDDHRAAAERHLVLRPLLPRTLILTLFARAGTRSSATRS